MRNILFVFFVCVSLYLLMWLLPAPLAQTYLGVSSALANGILLGALGLAAAGAYFTRPRTG
jgi:hypothetical protein